jgi:hypothetical protein
MKAVQIVNDRIQVSERLVISFQRTLRIPDDGQVYPLPPTLGFFPIRRAVDFPSSLPEEWTIDRQDLSRGIFIPMYQSEAMWIAFEAAAWKPNAVKVGVGRINALTGEEWSDHLTNNPQNYIVCPEQPWLDGFNISEKTVRQFIAAPLGDGETVESQISGEEKYGGIQILVFEPVMGLFPDNPPALTAEAIPSAFAAPTLQKTGMEFGLAAGGKVAQKIYPDPHGLPTWEGKPSAEFQVWLVNGALFSKITGEIPPPSPVSARDYSQAGLPWFEWYDEDRKSLDAILIMAKLKSAATIRAESGQNPDPADDHVSISPDQIRRIGADQDDRQP